MEFLEKVSEPDSEHLVNLLEKEGFAFLAVPPSPSLHRLLQQTKEFFNKTAEIKQSVSRTADNNGYVAFGQESLDPTAGQADFKECFNVTINPMSTRFPPDFPELEEAVKDFLEKTAIPLARQVLARLGPAYAAQHFAEPSGTTLRLLHYPPLPPGAPEQVAAGAHTDYGSLTLLWRFSEEQDGLQVRALAPPHAWLPVPCIPNTVLLNIGDLLAAWSGRLTSTTHRVLRPPQTHHRYAIAFFVHPNDTFRLPSGLTAAEFLQNKLTATY